MKSVRMLLASLSVLLAAAMSGLASFPWGLLP